MYAQTLADGANIIRTPQQRPMVFVALTVQNCIFNFCLNVFVRLMSTGKSNLKLSKVTVVLDLFHNTQTTTGAVPRGAAPQ